MSYLHRLKAMAIVLALAVMGLQNADAKQRTVAVVGDSLSVGLAAALQARSPGVAIAGYGVISSSLIRSYPVDWQRRIQEVASTAPSFVVALVGMNDTDSSWDLAYERAVTSFLDPLRRAGIPFAMVAVPYTRDPVRNRGIDQMNSMLASACQRMGGRFLQLGNFPDEERMADGIHFTASGYQDMARRVVSGLGH
jgi:hypothetical protein